MEYEELEPFPARRSDIQAASICAAICNTILATKRIKKRFTISDFVLQWDKESDVPAERQRDETDGKEAKQNNSLRMKMVAQMSVALASAELKKKARRRG